MASTIKVIGNQNLLFGTCQIGETWGQVEDADETLQGDIDKIADCCGGTQAVLIKDERFELKITVILSSLATPPELGDDITFPTVGITGQILKRGKKWKAGDAVKMDVEATHWKSMGSTPAVTVVDCGA